MNDIQGATRLLYSSVNKIAMSVDEIVDFRSIDMIRRFNPINGWMDLGASKTGIQYETDHLNNINKIIFCLAEITIEKPPLPKHFSFSALFRKDNQIQGYMWKKCSFDLGKYIRDKNRNKFKAEGSPIPVHLIALSSAMRLIPQEYEWHE